MSIKETTPKDQREELRFELRLPHPLEKVWRAISEPELLEKWLLPSLGFNLAPGTKFTFQQEPMPGWDGVVCCEMLEVVLHQSLRWRWVVGDIDTIVSFTLSPTPSGTLLQIAQSGFKPEQKQNFGGARWGWNMMGEKLIDLLTGLSQ